MIKADGPRKVKERLSRGARPDRIFILFFAAFFTISRLAIADASESEVQSMEEQEFGIGDQTIVRPSPVPRAPVVKTVPEETQTPAPPEGPEKIRPIEAEEFKIKLTKTSTSGNVLLFEDPAKNNPRPGKILLLKNDKKDIGAVRVLKNYPDKFAARLVLNFEKPEVGQEYRALKKLGDKYLKMIKERERRGKDVDVDKTDDDLAKEIAPDDEELDRGIPKPKADKKKKKKSVAPASDSEPEASDKSKPLWDQEGNELASADSIEVSDDDDAPKDLSVQDDLPLEPLHHAFSVEYASLRNVDNGNKETSYNGFGARYAYNFAKLFLFKKKSFQDLLTLELGLFYYSISGFSLPTDSVTVLPLVGTFRYNLLLGESFVFFGYAGILKNNLMQSSGTLSSSVNRLATTNAALGVGMMVNIGPHWAARIEYGTDMLGLGAVLKF